ncbi:hypothetical protein EYF80_024020 [Liparis tanakae]|uniref:Uncharacterized protein n=1 Tax=Liparis tanakae TaxID=230148 RepID=A0A4Z2HIX7_9TELE|nr:hypothetical protein EYF80_024020 [Liparis tanakae]
MVQYEVVKLKVCFSRSHCRQPDWRSSFLQRSERQYKAHWAMQRMLWEDSGAGGRAAGAQRRPRAERNRCEAPWQSAAAALALSHRTGFLAKTRQKEVKGVEEFVGAVPLTLTLLPVRTKTMLRSDRASLAQAWFQAWCCWLISSLAAAQWEQLCSKAPTLESEQSMITHQDY